MKGRTKRDKKREREKERRVEKDKWDKAIMGRVLGKQ